MDKKDEKSTLFETEALKSSLECPTSCFLIACNAKLDLDKSTLDP